MIINATTNQKLAAATKGSMEGSCDKREAQWKRNSIVLGALDVNSLTAIDGHDRQYFNELRARVVSP